MPRAKRPNPANNRSDLLTPSAPKRKMTAPGQEYGKQTAQRQSQTILPVGPPPGPTPSGFAGTPAQANEPGSNAPGVNTPPPRQVSDWLRPTERPQEPITAGMAGGPGPGPSSLTGLGQLAQAPTNENASLQSLLSGMAQRPGASSVIKVLASRSGAQVI